ncbi:Gfo/Idh/MocA family oxidoreductase [Cyclobacterium sp. 1_MG-2023]|uniref:Gfo/Idh/MocA family protein n=1 Tax=Cyclobacterium sp. 1_MG-2023 TaxID=3062681 RepID=UPI0026E2EF94|nr:Gfo/Idh/MocA family oxidoreductase [Cyclobacterium sp. 1_MG-2023]MDO6438164.1 Gfo/Idh/MocA family oxidoreductase [Cyclobacterium sp. 1_MG-2023]
MSNRKLKMGMIGGGPGSFIGAVHRISAAMDGIIELAAGAFSSSPEKSAETGKELFLPSERVYGSYDEMFEKELLLPESERIDFVAIVTPNHVHFDPTKKALENGFHVVLDKPMTFSYEEAKELNKIIEQTGLLFCLTHTYTGYPMVKEAKHLIATGVIGKVRKVYVEYPQGWLWNKLENTDYKQAIWRTDPSKSGIANCMGDIGTHAFNLAEYVSGLKLTKLCADLNCVVDGRTLDDDGAVLLKFEDGASGVLMATQIAPGAENNIKIRVYGEKAGLEWEQDNANSLIVRHPEAPDQIYRAGGNIPYLSSSALENVRTPGGHPEGYLEAFANLYRNFARCLYARKNGETPKKEWEDYPGAEDGMRGMAFVEHVVKSSNSNEKWTKFEL